MLGGHKHNLVCTRTQEKGAVTPQETDTDLSGSVQEPPEETWAGGGQLQGRGHWGQPCVHCTAALRKEATIILITSTIVWSQVGQQGGHMPHPLTETWTRELLSVALPIRTRPSFLLSQSLPSGSFHKPLILLQQRADRMKTTVTEN